MEHEEKRRLQQKKTTTRNQYHPNETKLLKLAIKRMQWKAIYSNGKKEKESKQKDQKLHKKETNLYRLKKTLYLS